ncbi:MAG: DUF3693 domain-containing protein, partial [Pseudomonadota bacterium]
MRTIHQVLDQALRVQKVKSDYKLSLITGVSESSLSTYRKGISLPDEVNCKKLAAAIGEAPELLTVEMQAQRAKNPEARQIWLNIAKRMQMGFANVSLMLAIAIVLIALTSPAARAASDELFSPSGSLYIMLSAVTRIIVR